MRETGPNRLEQVDCGHAAATLKVVGRVDNKQREEANINVCAPFKDQGPVGFYWGMEGRRGFVLCLMKIAPRLALLEAETSGDAMSDAQDRHSLRLDGWVAVCAAPHGCPTGVHV